MIKNIIVGVISVIVAVIASLALVGNNQPNPTENPNLRGGTRFINGISADSTSPNAGQVRGTTLTVTGDSTLTGTSTTAKSPDGFVAYMGFTVATGTAKAVYTNPSSDLVCDGSSAFFQGIGTTFAPSLVVAFGTSTSATGYSTNLLASTTLATTTNNFFAETFVTPFRLKSGESIVGALSDIANSGASSTYYSNWNMQYGVQCWIMGS